MELIETTANVGMQMRALRLGGGVAMLLAALSVATFHVSLAVAQVEVAGKTGFALSGPPFLAADLSSRALALERQLTDGLNTTSAERAPKVIGPDSSGTPLYLRDRWLITKLQETPEQGAANASVQQASRVSYQANAKATEILCRPQIFGNVQVPADIIVGHLASKQGDAFDLATIRQDLELLWATGYFSRVSFERVETTKCVQLEVHVQEVGQEVVQDNAHQDSDPLRVRVVIMQAKISQANPLEAAAAQKGSYEPGFEILSNTLGCEEFMGYMSHLYDEVKRNWGPLVPASAQAPRRKKGVVGIRLTILPDGSVQGPMHIETSSGDVALDKAAWEAITSEGKFPPLPKEFTGPSLELRVGFFYNMRIPEGKEGGETRNETPIRPCAPESAARTMHGRNSFGACAGRGV